jgi:hypothetical protein
MRRQLFTFGFNSARHCAEGANRHFATGKTSGFTQGCVGFVAGFGAWYAMEQRGWVDDCTVRQASGAVHRSAFALRHGDGDAWVEKAIPKTVKAFLDRNDLLRVSPPTSIPTTAMENSTDDRATLSSMLRECSLPEQLEWLSDHVSESVPYFWIEELVHTWAAMYFGKHFYGTQCAEPQGSHASPSSGAGDELTGVVAQDVAGEVANHKEFAGAERDTWSGVSDLTGLVRDAAADAIHVAKQVRQETTVIQRRATLPAPTCDGADDLIRGLWHHLASGVLSPQAGWGALAVLCQASEVYAIALAKHIAVDSGVVPAPYQPVRFDTIKLGSRDIESNDSPAGDYQRPIYAPRCSQIRDEREALACFIATVDAARRVTMKARDNAPGPSAHTGTLACGPPLDLVSIRDASINASPEKPCEFAPLRPPLHDYARWRESIESATNHALCTVERVSSRPLAVKAPTTAHAVNASEDDQAAALCDGSFAASMDPLVMTLAAVDAALTREAARHQGDRYDFAWTHPTNWFYPLLKVVGLKRKPVDMHGAETNNVSIRAAAVLGGFPSSLHRDPTLPFTIDRYGSLASTFSLIRDDHGVRDPEGLGAFLRAYTHSAAENISRLSKTPRPGTVTSSHVEDHHTSRAEMAQSLRQATFARVIACGRLLHTAQQVEQWMTATSSEPFRP